MPIHFGTLREDLTVRKRLTKDTGWRSDDIPPRFSVYPVSRPTGSRWEWRCLLLLSDDGRVYRLLIEVAPALGKWKAMLIKVPQDGPPVAIMRLEDQPGKFGGGLHIHAHCDQLDDLSGAKSVEMRYTLPDHRQHRRRRLAWTKALFCKASGSFFRTDPIVDQEEMAL